MKSRCFSLQKMHLGFFKKFCRHNLPLWINQKFQVSTCTSIKLPAEWDHFFRDGGSCLCVGECVLLSKFMCWRIIFMCWWHVLRKIYTKANAPLTLEGVFCSAMQRPSMWTRPFSKGALVISHLSPVINFWRSAQRLVHWRSGAPRSWLGEPQTI